MRTVVGVVLTVVAVALVVAAALGTAPLLVLPVPWGIGLLGVAMLAVVAQPSASRAARTAARVLLGLGTTGALAAWGAWLAGYERPEADVVRLDSVVDVGSSTAALCLAALVVVATSAGSRSGQGDPDDEAGADRATLSADA
jgi:hypothetical protein